jgi:hypothetical protein
MANKYTFIVYPLWPLDPVSFDEIELAKPCAKKFAKKFDTGIVIRKHEWDHSLERFVDSFMYAVEPSGQVTRSPWKKT